MALVGQVHRADHGDARERHGVAGGSGGSGVVERRRVEVLDVDAVGDHLHLVRRHAELALGLLGDGGGVGHDGVGHAAGQAQRASLRARRASAPDRGATAIERAPASWAAATPMTLE